MNRTTCALLLGFVWLSFHVAIADEREDPFTSYLSVSRNDDGFLISENGQGVLQYQLREKSLDGKWPRSNYVHPLVNLDGEVITEDFPADHGHHRGVFWAWHQVHCGAVRLGDAWICEDFQWQVESAQAALNSDGSATVSARMLWKSPKLTDAEGGLIAVVREQTSITLYPATSEYRQVDFDIRLQALMPDVRIGGSEDDKGYGGFSPRIRLSQDQVFLAADGEVEPTTAGIAAGEWMDISDPQWGMAIFTHPTNPGYPQPWILRRQRSMQNVVYPGRELTPLAMDRETRLRYRLLIHRGSNSSLDFAQLQQQYSQDLPNRVRAAK